MKELAQEARMAALRYQINPHFLFNTLNSISSLVLERRNAEAETMLLNLSTFLRATLAADPGGTIALREEIRLQQLYLAIEEVRFPDRMHVTVDIPCDLSALAVPALILQPLVENALRYAVEPSESMTTVSITAKPGKISKCGATRRKLRASFSITPQLGVGGCTPKPRKLKLASDKTAPAIPKLA